MSQLPPKIPVARPLTAEEEVAEELSMHMELLARRYQAEGLTAEQARLRAEERFGNSQRYAQECTVLRADINTQETLSTFWQSVLTDARFALRAFRHRPSFSLLTSLTLALGIGATVGVLNLVYAVLLHPLPYANADRVRVLWNGYAAGPAPFSGLEFFDIQAGVRSFEHIAAIRQEKIPLIQGGSDPMEVTTYRVSPQTFHLLGVAPTIGTGFTSDASDLSTVILSDVLWRTRFGGDSSILGKAIDLGGIPRTVVGVMPPNVRFPDVPIGYLQEPADLWVGDSHAALRADERGNQFLVVLGLPRAGSPVATTRRELDAVEAQFKREYPERYSPPNVAAWRLADLSLSDELFGRVRQQMFLLASAALVMLAIACSNVANLLLSRGLSRHTEFAVRRSLGGQRKRLRAQLLTEAIVLGAISGGLGGVVALLIVRVVTAAHTADIPRIATASMSAAWWALSISIGVVAGLLAGLVPALRLSQETTRHATTQRALSRHRLQRGLASTQVALAMAVLVATGLFLKSFLALQRVENGFHGDGVVTTTFTLPRARYDSAYKIAAFSSTLLGELAVRAPSARAALVWPLPLSGEGWSGTFGVEGFQPSSGQPEPHAEYSVASGDYFRVMGIPLSAGRSFDDARDVRGADRVVVVDDRLARTFWPNESAVGQRIRVGGSDGPPATVIGVVRHVRRAGARDDGEPQLYLSVLQSPQRPLSLVMQSSTPQASYRVIEDAVHSLDAAQPLSHTTMSSLVDGALAQDRFNVAILGVFGVVALALVSMGLYGLISLTTGERLAEFSVRLALGAHPWSVRTLVLRDASWVLALGVAGGVAISLAASRLLQGLLFGTQAVDAFTYGGIALLLSAVTVGAALRIALQATEGATLRLLRQG